MTEQTINDALKEQLSQLKSPNIVVVGRTGAGKSTLINSVFGVEVEYAKSGAGRPITDGFYRYPPEGEDNPLPMKIYDSAGYEATQESQFLQTILKFLDDKQKEGLEEQIHLVWYVINATTARVEKFDTEIIKRISQKKIPAIIVISQCDRANPSQDEKLGEIEAIEQVLREDKCARNYDLVQVAASPLIVRGNSVCEPFGLQELIDKTIEKIPSMYADAIIATQIVDLKKKRRTALNYIYTAAIACFAGSIIPPPGSTPVVTLTSQTGLFIAIAYTYGYKEIAALLVGILTPTIASLNVFISGIIGDLIAIFFPPASAVIATGSASYIVAFGLACIGIFEKMSRDNIYGQGKEAVKQYIQDNFKKELEKYKDLKIKSTEDLDNIKILYSDQD